MALFGLVGRSEGSGNYAYVNARVRAKKAFLLPPETYPKLIARDLPEIARTLQEGQYQAEIDELAARYRGAELIERATRLNLGRVYDQILGFSEGELRTMLALFMQRYDVQNLKTVLRGRFGGSPAADIVSELVPLGTIPRAELEALAASETLEDVLEAISKTPYGGAVKEYVDSRQRPANLVAIENAIDKAFYRQTDDAVDYTTRPKAAYQAFLRREVDIVNLRTLFRLKAEGITEIGDLFVPGGRDVNTPEKAQRILRANGDELLSELAKLPFWDTLEPGVRAFLAGKGLNPVMNALERAFLASARSFGHSYPLSVLPVVDFLLAKKTEVDNIRAIGYGKQTGLRDEVLKELVIA